MFGLHHLSRVFFFYLFCLLIIYHAKTASTLITDVTADSPTAGVVDVRVLLKDGELPGEEIIKTVLEKLSDEKIRPLTDYVTVAGPDTKAFNIDLTYYIPAQSEKSPPQIQSECEKKLSEYIKWQTEKMGRDINPSKLSEMLMSAGLKRVEIRAPVFTRIGDKEVAKFENLPTFIYGGAESE